MMTHSQVVAYIKLLREEHVGLGKEKIKPLLDAYCQKEGLPTIQESTIGKVIKRKNFFLRRVGKYIMIQIHNGHDRRSKGKNEIESRNRQNQQALATLKWIPWSNLLMESEYIFYTAIDAKLKFAFSLPYAKLTSSVTVDFFQKLQSVYPIPITTVQTDNGLEFLGDFDQYLEKQHIPHVFIYPRCCKINGTIERFNRTIQEDCIDPNLHLFHDPKLFSSKLMDYLLFYNTQRVHKSLGLKTPLGYLQEQKGLSNISVTYTPACTINKTCYTFFMAKKKIKEKDAELIIEDIIVGKGEVAKDGDTLVVHYTGFLEDGTKFDSSKDRDLPFEVQIGAGYVIRGWDLGIPGMKVGGKRKLTIPHSMGYGKYGTGGIPGFATLIFEVELLKIK